MNSGVERIAAAFEASVALIAGLDLTSAKMATVNGQPVQGQQPSQADQISPSSAPNAAANVHAASNAYAILGASIACMLRTQGRSQLGRPIHTSSLQTLYHLKRC